MENYIYIALLVITSIMFAIIFKISLKKAKSFKEDKELEKITDKFPENVEIAKEMLKMLGNEDVKIEEAKDTGTSLYIAITNKISIADMKNNYARIQTIAHECLHSCQERALLLFNFTFSNINILYFLTISILTICRIINNQMLQVAILMLFMLIGFVVRSYLEIDAMTESKFLAKEYMEKKKLVGKKEQEKLLEKYKEINEFSIPFTLFNLLVNGFAKVLIYVVICVFI